MSSIFGAVSYKEHLVPNAGMVCYVDTKVEMNAILGVWYFMHDRRLITYSNMLQMGDMCV
jgi:hypothetical protein